MRIILPIFPLTALVRDCSFGHPFPFAYCCAHLWARSWEAPSVPSAPQTNISGGNHLMSFEIYFLVISCTGPLSGTGYFIAGNGRDVTNVTCFVYFLAIRASFVVKGEEQVPLEQGASDLKTVIWNRSAELLSTSKYFSLLLGKHIQTMNSKVNACSGMFIELWEQDPALIVHLVYFQLALPNLTLPLIPSWMLNFGIVAIGSLQRRQPA